ncbi:UPF0481 protein-like [Iris pallida]|uniref:UPF0481 protein-like n=1 Tax=Iris pallida TaxID=29817 RepID=A0AAX6E9J0_IRIPA|nr:UPF0481 protein-like [Iris pallida]
MDITENSCVLDLDQEWLASLRKKVGGAALRKHRRGSPPTIFRAPASMRQADPDAYSPHVVSLGPYHRNSPALKPMDGLKLRYLQKVLLRNPKAPLEAYVRLIQELEPAARASYSEDIDMDSHSFVEMLLLDGCFVVELLLMQLDGRKHEYEQHEDGESEEDPILTTTWTMPLIESDMLMLENQIPFSVLRHVYDLATGSDECCYSIVQLAQAFFNDYLPTDRLVVPSEDFLFPKYFHLLHFFHSCIMPGRAEQCYKPLIYQKMSRRATHGRPPPAPGSIPSATRLKEAGVAFETNAEADSFLDVGFRGSVMAIPTLRIYDHTDSLFRNLIAFEQCLPRVGTRFATYATMMDCLVGGAEDVALLHRCGCIVSGLGSDDVVARLFSGLRRDATVDWRSCYLAGLFEDVRAHCDSRWNKWRAKLMHDYFSNPWSVVSLIAALVLIFLTVVQAWFALLSYVFPPR